MKKFFWAVFLILVFLCSAGLIGYSWLVFQISRGVAATRHGELETAAGFFELAETPFRTVPLLSRILKDDYEKLTFAQVNVLFAQGEPEVIFDRFEEAVRSSPTIKDQGDFSFWMGNLLFRRAVAKVGLGPLTSMFFFGPNDRIDVDDFRPSVHDSDGLAIFNGRGEELWRPLSNPRDLQISTFSDLNPTVLD